MKEYLLSMLLAISSYSLAITGDKMAQIEQPQLLKYWDRLDPEEKEQLLAQINQIDVEVLRAQQNAVLHPVKPKSTEITPFREYAKRGSQRDFQLGKKLIAEGKVGCLVVAGGQGTRLGCTGPKGVMPVTVIKDKSLFQLLAERVLAAGKQAKRRLLLAIMTSPANHDETLAFFERHDNFGLERSQLFFFSQEELPLLDEKGMLFLETPSKISTGPDGNAASLKHFVRNGIWSTWHQLGVQYVNYIHIDNPLIDPFDAELIGYQHREKSDVVIKCIERENPLEKVGIILKNDGKVGVIEYSEISPAERDAKDANGTLKHLCANISAFSFSMDFVQEIGMKHYDQLPFHTAWKAVKYLGPDGEVKMAEKPMAWKFEKFIFDVLAYSQAVKALLYPRFECFSPLKNANGSDTIKDVQLALQRYDRMIFAKVTGVAVDETKVFELDPQFYYPTPELLAKWKGRKLPNANYIEASNE